METVYLLSSRCDIFMTEEQQAAKYISGLKYPIQECVTLHDVFFSIDEAHNKALKVEILQCRTLLSKPLTPIKETTTETSAIAPMRTAAPVAKGKENLYVKSGVGKYYRCDELGHKSNECQRRRQVNIADYESEDEVKIETELEDSDFVKEHEESVQ